MKKIIIFFCIVILFLQGYSNANEKINDAELEELRVNYEGIVPSFDENVFKYYLTVPLEIDNIEVFVKPRNKNSSIEITGNTSLKEGINLIEILVKSEKENKRYTIEVTKTDNFQRANTNLENLAIQNVLLNPAFDTNITNYYIEISNDISSLNILAIPQNENSKVEIDGMNNLQIGNNKINITVIGENGFSKKIYQIECYKRSPGGIFETKDIEAKKTTYNAEKLSINKTKIKNKTIYDNEKIFLIVLGIIFVNLFLYKYFKEL